MVIYLAGQTVPNLIYLSSIMEGYDPETDDNWFIQFQVENGRLKDLFTDAPTGTSNTTPFDGDAEASTDQTYFRLPLIYSTEGEKITNDLSGIYRENVVCTATGPKAELIRIG
ncbi:MAG TPA: hypothetical protein DEA90_10920 [Opitutae bacterium]|nr:hypothetical protein [Opitutae bacterium]